MEGLPRRWNLDAVYRGGAESEAMLADLERAERMCGKLRRLAGGEIPGALGEEASLKRLVLEYSDARMLLGQLESYVSCLMAEDTEDRTPAGPLGRIAAAMGELEGVAVAIGHRLLALSSKELESLLGCSELAGVSYAVGRLRHATSARMDLPRESLASRLAVDGYHGWSRLYDTLVAEIRVRFQSEGGTREVSPGQARNLMRSPSRDLRRSVFHGWRRAWDGSREPICAALNGLAGFRLSLYGARGWDSVLAETLEDNRTSPATLEAMWGAVERGTDQLPAYLAAKAGAMGLGSLSWYDLEAPVGDSDQVGFEEAAGLVVETFGGFSSKMGTFAEMALREGWVESADRPGKAPGAFCTDFPVEGESRVFTTFGGGPSSAATLAHELGHAWHGHVLRDRPYLAREYPMTLAETASTFAENLVANALLEGVGDGASRLSLLDDMASRAVALMLNIRARYLFETRFYRERSQGGPLSSDRLCRLMEDAQREAYMDALEEYHPLFWASKLHFYATDAPFYNWPYTFGFLFSMGVWARARQEGDGFAGRYRRLLEDTGSMSVEELAAEHLDADLTDAAFWDAAVAEAVAPAEEATRLLS